MSGRSERFESGGAGTVRWLGVPRAARTVLAGVAGASVCVLLAGTAASGAVRAAAAPVTTAVPVTTAITSARTTGNTVPVPGTVFQTGFETGTTEGFVTTTSNVGVLVSTAAARTGSYGLVVNGINGYGQGAQKTLPGTLAAGYYGVTAMVRLPNGTAQDMQITVSGANPLQAGISRATSAGWVQLTTYFNVATPGSVSLRIESVAHCSDAPAVPLPFWLDDITVSGYGTVPVPFPLLPTPSCPLNGSPTSTTATSPVTTTTSRPVTTTTSRPVTTTTAARICRVVYSLPARWAGGIQGNIGVTNISSTAWNGWVLTWTVPSGEQIQQVWGAGAVTISGAAVKVVNPPWASVVPPGGTVNLGFLAAWSGAGYPPVPVDFAVNGQPCEEIAAA